MEEQNVVSLKIEGSVAVLEFFHPKANSLTKKILTGLIKAIDSVSHHKTVKVLVLRSSKDAAFCAGANLDELKAAESEADLQYYFNLIGSVLIALKSCSSFTVCEIQGPAVGGGVGLVAACDYSIASARAYFSLSELRIGLAPFVISPALIRRIGYSAFSEMSIDCEKKDVSWAQRKNLISRIEKNPEKLEHSVEEFCENLATYKRSAISLFKSSLWSDTDYWQEEMPELAQKSASLICQSRALV